MSQKTISIIIPSYNEEMNIGDCLESLLRQSKKAEEILIVDDGSTDNTVKIASSYPVKIIKSNHSGPGSSRNLGASKATGNILVFVDADMTFDPDFLKFITSKIVSGKAKGVFNTREYVANYENVLARCWNLNNGLRGKERMDASSLDDTEDFRAILKSEFDRVGGFDSTGYTDSRTLVKKLGYRPEKEIHAISYHANPETFTEVFLQAKWIGKRKTKFGIAGKIFNLIKYSLPFSLLTGIYKAVIYCYPQFIVFKLVYDFGFFSGVISSIFNKNLSK